MNQTNAVKSVSDVLTGRLGLLTITPDQMAQRRKEAEEFRRRQQEGRIKTLLAEAHAPLRQLNQTQLDRQGEWAAAEAKINGNLGSGFLVALIGTRGSGKTQLAVETMRVNADQGKRSRYGTATEFFIEIKSTYDRQTSRTEKEVLEEFSKPSLLVLDEIGRRSESEWENRLLFELLNRRYNALKDTLLISNQSPEEFANSIGSSLISRMIETGGLINCTWPSYRQPEATQLIPN